MAYHSHEAGDARSLNLKNVVVWSDAEVVATEGEGHIWETVTLLALNSVLSIVALLGTNLLVEELSKSGWESNEGSSGVKNDTRALELSSRVTEGNGIKINLPVGLASQWDGGDLASVVVLVDTPEGSLRLVTLSIGISEVESKDLLVQKTLINHVVEWRWDLVNGDGIESKTQNTIESAKGKGKTWLLGSFGEDLVLDLEVPDGHNILGNESAQAARAISDLK